MTNDSSLLQDLMLLSRAARLVLEEEVLKSLQEAKITTAKMTILRLLSRQGRQSVTHITAFLGQTKAAVSQNVESLVRSKYVSRVRDKADRRCVWVSITARGHRFLERAEKRQMETLRRVTAGLSEKALTGLAKGMRSLAFALLEGSSVETETCLGCCAFNSAGCVQKSGSWHCGYIDATRKSPATGVQ